jgi:hypothetical protein
LALAVVAAWTSAVAFAAGTTTALATTAFLCFLVQDLAKLLAWLSRMNLECLLISARFFLLWRVT